MNRIHLLGNDIDTDQLIPARFCKSADPSVLAQYCLCDVRPGFHEHVQHGDLLVAGRSFGCGSSREAAPLALRACGIRGVVAVSVARIFYRNAINIGLPVWTCVTLPVGLENGEPFEWVEEGRALEFGVKRLAITGAPTGIAAELVRAGGLIPYLIQNSRRLDGGGPVG